MPALDAPESYSFKRCQSCTHAVSTRWRLCTVCGADLPSDEPEKSILSTAPSGASEKEYFWINLGAAIAFIAMLVTGFMQS